LRLSDISVSETGLRFILSLNSVCKGIKLYLHEGLLLLIDLFLRLLVVKSDKSGNFIQGTKHLFIFVLYPQKFGRLFHLKRTVPFFFIKIYHIHWLSSSL
jgi:hypothetical protein